MQSVEMYELEICDKHILATYPSAQNGNTTPEKKFLQIPYDEIAKVDFQREYTRGQKVNFTIYHKSGCVELCIENPEEAAQMIEKGIKRVKTKEPVTDFSQVEAPRKESPKDQIKRTCACCGEVYFADSEEEKEFCSECLKELNL